MSAGRETPGYFGIGIYNPKREVNMGTLWRTADALGAAFTFQIGGRFKRQPSDTTAAYRHVPHFVHESLDDFFAAIPHACVPVAVELDDRATALASFTHPASAVYLLGAEDGGLPPAALNRCAAIVQLPGRYCINVAVAGSIVMYDRAAKPIRSRLERAA